MAQQPYRLVVDTVPSVFSVQLGGIVYWMRLMWADAVEGGWVLDIADYLQQPLICGIPLVTGVNLLAPYDYVGIPAKLWVETVSDTLAPPTEANLNTQSFIWVEED